MRTSPIVQAPRAAEPTLADVVRARLGGVADEASVASAVTDELHRRRAVLGPRALAATVRAVADEVLGAGALQPYLDDPAVSDVLVNGPREVWVERDGALQRVDVDLGDVGAVRALAVRLAAIAGQRLDDASPAVDGRLPGGQRLHAVLAPPAAGCTLLSLRVPRGQPFTLAELVSAGTVAPTVAPVLLALLATRANLLVTGSTGTGKTTLLAALLAHVDPGQRIVVIEEATELVVRHPHVVSLAARSANVEGSGAVELAALVRHALRMRPDRLVLGECRGAEVRDVLGALNTGHQGGCATLHANTAADVPARLEALGAMAGMTREAVAAQAAAALDAVVHLRRDPSGRRYLDEIGMVTRDGGGELVVVPAMAARADGSSAPGPAWDRLAARAGLEQDPPGDVVPLRTLRSTRRDAS